MTFDNLQPYKATYKGKPAWKEIESMKSSMSTDDIKDKKKDKKGDDKGSKLTFNSKAYKKYNSTKSLAERILKSNSEGNRFIVNDML